MRMLVFGIVLIPLVQSAIIPTSFFPENSSCTVAGSFSCPCYSQKDCKAENHLECIDNKCYCMNPLRRIYDNIQHKCVSLVGSACDNGSDLPRCIRNAICDDGRCTCQDEYVSTSELTCMLGYGQECGPFLCNSERGLACKEGICVCLDNTYVYSAITKRCFDPETYIRNLVGNVFDATFIRSVVLHSLKIIFRRVIRILKLPIRLPWIFIG